MEDNDKKSVTSTGEESLGSNANSTLSIIRYSTLDELLFNLLLTFHNENDFPISFSVLCLIWTVLNGISVTFTWNNWPLWGYFGKVVHDFFSWTDFSVSWQWSSFLMVMNVIFYLVTITVVIGLCVLTVLNRKEKPVPIIVTKLIGGTQYLLTHLFSYSGVNVLMGYYLCIGKHSSDTDPYPTNNLSCNTIDTVLMIISSIVLVVFFVVGVLERMFVFVYDSKLTPGDPFTGQSGFYNAMTCILLNVFSLAALFLRAIPAGVALIGLVFFLILCLYAHMSQPYYYPVGNALSSGVYMFCVVTFIFSCITLIIKDNFYLYDRLPKEMRTRENLPLSIPLVVVFWVLYIPFSLGSAFFMSWRTYKRSKKKWAMDENEELPIPKWTLKKNEKDGAVSGGYLLPSMGQLGGGGERLSAVPSLNTTALNPFGGSSSVVPSLSLALNPSASFLAPTSSLTLSSSCSFLTPNSSRNSANTPTGTGETGTGTTSPRAISPRATSPRATTAATAGTGISAMGPPVVLPPTTPAAAQTTPRVLQPTPVSAAASAESAAPPPPPSLNGGGGGSSGLSLSAPGLLLLSGSSSCSSGVSLSSTTTTNPPQPPGLSLSRLPGLGLGLGSTSNNPFTASAAPSLNPFASSSLAPSLSSSSVVSPFAASSSSGGGEDYIIGGGNMNGEPLKMARTIPKFHKPEDVLEAIRYLGVESLARRNECVSLAEEILMNGRKKFPTSSALWIGTALFHLVYTGNEARMGDALRNAKQNIPSFVERWLIFVTMRDIDRRVTSRNSGEGGSEKAAKEQSSTITFRVSFLRAQKAYETSKAFLVHAYGLLGKEHVDLNKSMRLLESAITQENLAHEELNELYETNPQTVQVLRLLGALLRDIYRDDDTATQLFMQATQIEDENAESERSHGDKASGGGDAQDAISEQQSGADKAAAKKRRKKRRQQQQSAIILNRKKEDLLSVFYPLLIVNFLVCLTSVVVGFVLTLNTFSSCTQVVTIINSVTSMMTYLIDVQLMMRAKIYMGVNDELPDSYIPSKATIDQYIREEKNLIDSSLDSIYKATVNVDEFGLWENEYIEEAVFVTRLDGTEYIPKAVIQNRVNLIELVKNIGECALFYVENDKNSDPLRKRHMNDNNLYVRANIAVVAMEAMKAAALHYAGNSEKNSLTQMWIGIIQGSVCVMFNIVVILAQYCIYTRNLNKERREVFLAFLMVPKEKILKLRKRLEDVDKEADDEMANINQPANEGALNAISDFGMMKTSTSNSDLGKHHDDSHHNTGAHSGTGTGTGAGAVVADDNFDDIFAADEGGGYHAAVAVGMAHTLSPALRQTEGTGTGTFAGGGAEGIGISNRGGDISRRNADNSDDDEEEDDDDDSGNEESDDDDWKSKRSKKNKRKKKKAKREKERKKKLAEDEEATAAEQQRNLEASAAADRVHREEVEQEKTRLAQEKSEREHVEQEEKTMDMAARVAKMQSSIPKAFFVRAIIGFLFLILCPIAFYVICAVAVNKVVERDVIIFLSEYRSVIMQLITQCAIFLTIPVTYDLPPGLQNCSFATTPMFSGFELFSKDPAVLQECMGNAITLLIQVNRVIIEGSKKNDPNHMMGDSLLDGYVTPRTTSKKSKTIKLLFDHETCFQNHPGDCDKKISQRIPQLDDKGFAGLSALLDFFIANAMALQAWDFSDGAHTLTMDEPHVAAVISCMMYDLRAGVTQYRQILVDEQDDDISMFRTLLILFFLLSIFMPISGFICCLMPTRDVLIGVAFASHKLAELNPTNEDSSKSALGAAQWNEAYVIDAPRFDNAHHALCTLAANLIVEMDDTKDVGAQSLTEISNMKLKLGTMREEQELKMVEECTARLRAEGYSEYDIALNVENERRKFENEGRIKNAITQALSNLMIGCFAVLSDEEYIMRHFRIPEQHRRSHFSSHAVFLRKLQTLSLSIASTVHNQNKDETGKDFSPEYNHHAQTLIQLVAAYMTDHVGKIDREMVTRLGGKIPESELSDVEVNLTQRMIPHSIREFLTSDNASIQDRNLFERMKKVLHLE